MPTSMSKVLRITRGTPPAPPVMSTDIGNYLREVMYEKEENEFMMGMLLMISLMYTIGGNIFIHRSGKNPTYRIVIFFMPKDSNTFRSRNGELL